MGTVHRLEDEASRLLRQISASENISFGSSIPHASLGTVYFTRIGFADQACVGFACATPDPSGFVPQARQHIMRAIDAAGLDPSAVDLCVHIGGSTRRTRFTDANESSRSCGKQKMGQRATFYLQVTRRESVASYQEALPKGYL